MRQAQRRQTDFFGGGIIDKELGQQLKFALKLANQRLTYSLVCYKNFSYPFHFTTNAFSINFHTSSLRKELVSRSGSGKKIDFILQELFRETSTLSVKLDIPKYKQIALDMKLIVEEMREQAQNIE